jgi:hypothetical protein
MADVVDSAKEKTQEQAHVAVQKGRGVVRDQVDQRSTEAGEQAQSLASTLRDTATQLRVDGDPQKARMARGADAGADQLERLGGYLTRADADELLSRLETFGRRQPFLLAGGGMLVGIVAGRFLKSSSHGRYYPSHQSPQPLRSAPSREPMRGSAPAVWAAPPMEPLSTPPAAGRPFGEV